MGSADPPGKIDEKLNSENMQKRADIYVCYILRAIRAGRCRERRYADHMFIQIYFRMHHFVVKFSNFLRLRWQGGIDRPNQNPADVPVQVEASGTGVQPVHSQRSCWGGECFGFGVRLCLDSLHED